MRPVRSRGKKREQPSDPGRQLLRREPDQEMTIQITTTPRGSQARSATYVFRVAAALVRGVRAAAGAQRGEEARRLRVCSAVRRRVAGGRVLSGLP